MSGRHNIGLRNLKHHPEPKKPVRARYRYDVTFTSCSNELKVLRLENKRRALDKA